MWATILARKLYIMSIAILLRRILWSLLGLFVAIAPAAIYVVVHFVLMAGTSGGLAFPRDGFWIFVFFEFVALILSGVFIPFVWSGDFEK